MGWGKPNQVFQFLLEQADQGDLDEAKEGNAYKNYPECRQAIDEAFKAALPVGSRHERFNESVKTRIATDALGTTMDPGVWGQELSDIIASYLDSGVEGIKAIRESIESVFPPAEGNESEIISYMGSKSSDVVGNGFREAVDGEDVDWLVKIGETGGCGMICPDM